MSNLKVTFIQTPLVWEDIQANLKAFDKLIDPIGSDTNLILLPEMFTTGFSMNAPKLAQSMGGKVVQWLKEKSNLKSADIAGSAIISEGGKYFNRLLWAKPTGELFSYDKRHLVRMVGENNVYEPGKENVTVELNGWHIRPFICYDLRFPGWCRNIGNQYDLGIFLANWPEIRASHWKALLLARAIENQCYIIGVNRVGSDGNAFKYSGDSRVIDPHGKIIFKKSMEPVVSTSELSLSSLKEYRASFPVWKDADENVVKFDYSYSVTT